MLSSNVVLYLLNTGIYILLGWAFYLPMRAGLVFNGPVYICGISAYFAAYAAKELGWPFGLIFFLSICIGTLVAFIPSRALARTRGLALALATIAIIIIVGTVIRNLGFLGGARGILNIPAVDGLLPITIVTVLIVGSIIYNIDHSKLGRALDAMRTYPNICGALGCGSNLRLSVTVQCISGAIAGAAGAIWPFVAGAIRPATFDLPLLLYIWTIVFVGGQGTLWGTLAFAPVIWGLLQIIPPSIAGYTEFIFGGLLIGILVTRPQGAINKKMLKNISDYFSGRGKQKRSYNEVV